jgi:hypothetical protein
MLYIDNIPLFYSSKNGDLFPHFPEIETAKDAASDHGALWVDLNV